MTEKVKFDPGIGELAEDIMDYTNKVYSKLMSCKTLYQKKSLFKIYSTQLEKIIKNNISFYAGCLLWAYYIYTENKENPKEIEGNPFLNLTKDELQNYDFMQQINFLKEYTEIYKRDLLYYTGKKYEMCEKNINIIKLYEDFIKINNGFISTKLTSDIILPEMLKNMKCEINIPKLINEVISKKEIELFLDNDFWLKS